MTNSEARSVGVCQHGGLRRQCETCDLADRLEQAEERIAELRAQVSALRDFAAHLPTCDYRSYQIRGNCTCGLAALLAEEPQP